MSGDLAGPKTDSARERKFSPDVSERSNRVGVTWAVPFASGSGLAILSRTSVNVSKPSEIFPGSSIPFLGGILGCDPEPEILYSLHLVAW